MGPRMRFRILGPVQVWDGRAWSRVRAGQQRLVLAVLLVEAGRIVSVDRLVDEIWGERPPSTAANTIQACVMRLRRLIGDGVAARLATRNGGYELTVDPGELDA